MLASKQIKVTVFLTQVNNARRNSILLTHLSSLEKYTFLNISTKNIGSKLKLNASKVSFDPLNLFIQLIQQRIPMLNSLKNDNYSYKDLQNLDQQSTPSSLMIRQFKDQIKLISSQFYKLKDHIYENINRSNFHLWINLCINMQVIDIKIWNKLLLNTRIYIRQMDQNIQNEVIRLVHTYISTKFMKFTHAPSKFIYRESMLADINSVSQLLFILIKIMVNRKEFTSQTIKSFQSTIQLIDKLSKNTIVNFNLFVQEYLRQQQDYIRIISSHNSLELSINFLYFYSILGIADSQKLSNIQKSILSQLNKEIITINHIQTLFKAWSLLAHYNKDIYNLVRPIIFQNIAEPNQKGRATTLLFDMISSNIKDDELVQQMISYIEQKHHIQNKLIHIVKHYHNINSKIYKISSFLHCHPNSVSQIIAQQHGCTYSNCLNSRNTAKYQDKINSIFHKIAHKKQLGVQHNPPQQFWLQILAATYDKIKIQYPHPDNALYFNFFFCVFQIDALVILNGKFIAFELVGTHYMHKQTSREQETQQGKKMIKSKILKAYGIKICQIKSFGLIQRTISSFQDRKNGEKYVRQKLSRTLSLIDQDYI